jgi:predicted extracellular nuclease
MKISVATFNVENLIGAGKAIYDEPRPHYSDEVYQQKTGWIRGQLLKMSADIVGFQEVFEEAALRDCLKGTPMETWNLVLANPTGKGPVNALLSRYPIVNTRVIDKIPFTFNFFDDRPSAGANGPRPPTPIPIEQFSRGVLLAELSLRPGSNIIVGVVHLKSKRPITEPGVAQDTLSYPDMAKGSIRSLIRRGIEAAGVRHILSDRINEQEEQPLIVLGDMNDSDTAVTSEAIIGQEPYRNLAPEIKVQRWKQVFQNCRDVQARKSMENVVYSYVHNGHYECLDNIFVSNHFADLNAKKLGRVIDVRTYNDHVIDDKTSLDRKPAWVSDHGQIVANLELFDSVPPPVPARD